MARVIDKIDFESCKECGYCKTVCPRGCFSKGEEFNKKGYRAFTVINKDQCIGCMKCFYACPDFALSMTEKDTVKGEKS